MFTIVSFLITLAFLIFIHELGHYLAARAVGVTVLEFSIGFPPKLASKKVGETEYLISAIPLGGYVRLLGQDTQDEDPTQEGNYASKTKWQRFFILAAGPAMNLLLAFLVMPLFFLLGSERPAFLDQPPRIGWVEEGSLGSQLGIAKGDVILLVGDQPVATWQEFNQKAGNLLGKQALTLTLKRGFERPRVVIPPQTLDGQPQNLGLVPYREAVVGKVYPGSAAALAGFLEGDRILSLAEKPIEDWSQLTPYLQETKGVSIPVLVRRQGQEVQLQVKPDWNQDRQTWVLGLSSPMVQVSYGPVESVALGVERVLFMGQKTFEFLGRLFTGQESTKSMGGPIQIAYMIGQAAKTGWGQYINLLAFISLQLGILNLLPIPALDGGHILFLAIEKIHGSPLSKKLRERVQMTGFSLLILMILYISVQDGLRLLG